MNTAYCIKNMGFFSKFLFILWHKYLFERFCLVLFNKDIFLAEQFLDKFNSALADSSIAHTSMPGVFKPESLKQTFQLFLKSTEEKEFGVIYRMLYSYIKTRNEKYFLIGISVVYPEQLFFSLVIAKVIKEKFNKNLRVVLGGPMITKNSEYLIEEQAIYDFVDFFVANDGEKPLVELLNEPIKSRLSEIPNLFFKNTEAFGKYEKSKGTFYLYPEDYAAPDFKGFNLDYYGKTIPVLASKGCFWGKCSFCTYSLMQQHEYRKPVLENVITTIEQSKIIHGVCRYYFVDDALPPSFLMLFANRALEVKLEINWECSLILSKELLSVEFCQLLRKAGLRKVKMGLESISSRILKLMNKYHKDMSEIELQQILNNLHEAGISIVLHVIFGFPTEMLGEAQQTLNFLIKNKDICTPSIQPFSLEENVSVYNNPWGFGITAIHKEDKDSGIRWGYRYEVATGMSQEEAKKFTEEAIKTCCSHAGAET
ncbi:MAG: radical SAM protein [Elusimicrobia bacterium]|nr:radical SAM protein [Elusimicrobiota bacterium]